MTRRPDESSALDDLMHGMRHASSPSERDDRMTRLIERAYPWVRRIARSVAHRYRVDLVDDLTQEGMCALMRAIDRFDDQRATSFFAYASRWIGFAMRRAVKDHLRGMWRQDRTHAADAPSDGHHATLRQRRDSYGSRHPIIIPLDSAMVDRVSLESAAACTHHGSSHDDSADLDRRELRAALLRALSAATSHDRDVRIMLLRYGLADGEEWTLKRIAQRYGITAERVRQITNAVTRRMQHDHELQSWHDSGDDAPGERHIVRRDLCSKANRSIVRSSRRRTLRTR